MTYQKLTKKETNLLWCFLRQSPVHCLHPLSSERYRYIKHPKRKGWCEESQCPPPLLPLSHQLFVFCVCVLCFVFASSTTPGRTQADKQRNLLWSHLILSDVLSFRAMSCFLFYDNFKNHIPFGWLFQNCESNPQSRIASEENNSDASLLDLHRIHSSPTHEDLQFCQI